MQYNAVVKFRELSADERTRDLYERREKARRDQAAREKWAFKQSKFDTARAMLADEESIERIMRYTNLTNDEIENLKNVLIMEDTN